MAETGRQLYLNLIANLVHREIGRSGSLCMNLVKMLLNACDYHGIEMAVADELSFLLTTACY